jgi:hypothetical protein
MGADRVVPTQIDEQLRGFAEHILA